VFTRRVLVAGFVALCALASSGVVAASTNTWTVTASRLRHGSYAPAISCPTVGSCLVVGDVQSGPYGLSDSAFTMLDDHGKLKRRRHLAASNGLSCVPRWCMAVGAGASGPLVQRWNGLRWTGAVTLPPAPIEADGLYGDSCLSRSNCYAVGSAGAYTTKGCPQGDSECFEQVGLFDHWNGRTWKRRTFTGLTGAVKRGRGIGFGFGSGAISGNPWVALAATSCTSSSWCMVIGQRASISVSTSSEKARGVLLGLEPGLGIFVGPEGVSYLNAEGGFGSSFGSASETDSFFGAVWNGRAWSTRAIPTPSSAALFGLNSLSCAAPNSCLAAGLTLSISANNLNVAPLLEAWNGHMWRRVHPRVPRHVTSWAISGISCVHDGACVIVGGEAPKHGRQQPLAERWSHGKFTTLSVPVPPKSHSRGGTYLDAVSCHTDRFCEAAGSYGLGSGLFPAEPRGWFLERYGP
jgi:hypothetical protein